MDKKELKKLSVKIFLGILFVAVGITLAVLAFSLKFFTENQLYGYIAGGAGGLIFVVSAIFTAVYGVRLKRIDRQEHRKLSEAINVNAEIDGSAHHNGESVSYIPSKNVYEFVNMGKTQSVEEKFDQISKMDKTQFVIYVAKLFSRKGYQVKLTPVTDNRNIDMLVEKMGTKIAVGCLLAAKIMSAENVRPIADGRKYYGAANAMALTNMYFDKTALELAKAEKMSLVDRNILSEDFM